MLFASFEARLKTVLSSFERIHVGFSASWHLSRWDSIYTPVKLRTAAGFGFVKVGVSSSKVQSWLTSRVVVSPNLNAYAIITKHDSAKDFHSTTSPA